LGGLGLRSEKSAIVRKQNEAPAILPAVQIIELSLVNSLRARGEKSPSMVL